MTESSDAAIIQVRRRLLKPATDLMEGQEPAASVNPNLYRVRNAQFSLPSGADAIEAVKPYMAPVSQ